MDILDFYSEKQVPDIVPSIGVQGKISKENCLNFGLVDNVKYRRAGDQPNNAFSLNVLNDGKRRNSWYIRSNILCYKKI